MATFNIYHGFPGFDPGAVFVDALLNGSIFSSDASNVVFKAADGATIDFTGSFVPGIPPTGKYLQVPHVAVVHFRGDKIAHEHIYWEQATALVQLGLRDPKGLPTTGADTARKVLDPSLPSNTLMAAWTKSDPDKK